jgi:hypothetical protein
LSVVYRTDDGGSLSAVNQTSRALPLDFHLDGECTVEGMTGNVEEANQTTTVKVKVERLESEFDASLH